MIKINLLPGYILEGRRVKTVLRLLVAILIIEIVLFAAYIWAPAPFCLSSQRSAAEQRQAAAWSKAQDVDRILEEANQAAAAYADREAWVSWVDESDALPEKWVRYFELITKYIPDDVVIGGLPLPSNNVLNLSGNTSGLRAAARWYLNMIRCEMVDPRPDAVTFSTNTVGWPGELPTGANPRMQQAVSISIALNPEFLPLGLVPPPPPSAAAGGGPAPPGGARMGGGGAGGMRGGGGMMGGGGMRGGGMGGGRMGRGG